MKLFVFVFLSRDTAFEEKTLRNTSQPVLDRTGDPRLLRTLATRDHDRRDVLARIERTVAITLPLDVFEIESDRRRQRRALDVDPSSDFFIAPRIDGDRASTGKGYAARPRVCRRLLPDRRKNFVDG